MTAISQVLKDILAKLKGDPTLSSRLLDSADILKDVGLDSLELLHFMLEVEARLAIQIDFDKLEYSYLSSIQTLAAFLETMPSRQAASSVG